MPARKKKDETPEAAPPTSEAEAAPARKAARKRAAPKEGAKAAAPKAPVERTRVVLGLDFYEPNKDEVKAPFKLHGLKWQFLGEGKGRYHKEGVSVFVQFTDAGVDYTVWGEDKPTVSAILDAWRHLLGEAAFARATRHGEEAVKEEQQKAESEALRLWRMQEPQPRSGEPEFFLKKRRDEWLARKPTE